MSRFFLFFVMCFGLMLNAQNYKIKVFLNNKKTEGYDVYLLKKETSKIDEAKLIKKNHQSSRLNLKLTKNEIKEYPFLEVISEKKGFKIVKISDLNPKKTNKIDIGEIVLVDFTKQKPKNEEEVIRIAKPAIYLYPEKDMEISVKLDFKGKVLTTYPAYNKGWKVLAKPNGELKNLADQRVYNYLFWDGNYDFPTSHFDYKEGFYVKKENYTQFLLEKLTHLGFNNTEINDFIVYWLPMMNKHNEVFIRFFVNDNIVNTTQLTITPKPDTFIDIYFEFKAYDGVSPKVKEQQLPKLKRGKYTAVEWGGAEIGSKLIQ